MFFKNRKAVKIVSIVISIVVVLSLVLGIIAPYIFS